MNESRRLVKLKDMKKEMFSFMPLTCGLEHRRTSTLQRFHIAVATHKGSPPRPIPHTSPPGKPRHTLISCTILFACLTSKPFIQTFLHGIILPLPRPTHWVTTSTHPYIDPFSNPVILHPLQSAWFSHSVRTPWNLLSVRKSLAPPTSRVNSL